jgi:plasmid stabilization system protein ParE
VPRIVVTEGAIVGLERCRRFLAPKNPRAAIRARQQIARNFLLLETTPETGRPLDDMPELRELIIGFGESGYVALYRYEPDDDAVYLLAFRHQREAGY